MAKSKGRVENLKPCRDTETAKARGKLGGIKSGESKRLKKLLLQSNEKMLFQRMEINFLDGLDLLLNGFDDIKVIRQFSMMVYRIDGFIPILNIAIEYDELHHKHQKKEDEQREKEINEFFKDKIIWIRVEQFKEFDGYGKIIKAVFNKQNGNNE